MIAHRDFAPHNLSPPSWRNGEGEWESFEDTLAAANKWIQSERIDVVNVETVVIACHVDAPAFAQTDAPSSFINSQHWHVHRQFIRVWYRSVEKPKEAGAHAEPGAAPDTGRP